MYKILQPSEKVPIRSTWRRGGTIVVAVVVVTVDVLFRTHTWMLKFHFDKQVLVNAFPTNFLFEKVALKMRKTAKGLEGMLLSCPKSNLTV